MSSLLKWISPNIEFNVYLFHPIKIKTSTPFVIARILIESKKITI